MKPNLLPLLFSLTLSLLASSSAAELTVRELESAIFALRANGYNLFGNSIAVSDLSFQILSLSGSDSGGFTFLAPPNSAVFSLDMAADSFSYVHSLRFHVVPRRLSFSDLLNLSLSSSAHLETLVPGHVLSVYSSGDLVSVDGVRVSSPDIYLRSHIAVHGLDGILGSSTEEHLHRHSSTSIPPIDAGFSSAFVGIPASSPRHFSISTPSAAAFSPDFDRIPESSPRQLSFSMPSENAAFSPDFDGVSALPPVGAAFSPALSPQQFSISPPEAELCHDWFGCDPMMESSWLPPTDFVPVPVNQSPESWEKSDGEEKKHESGHDKHIEA